MFKNTFPNLSAYKRFSHHPNYKLMAKHAVDAPRFRPLSKRRFGGSVRPAVQDRALQQLVRRLSGQACRASRRGVQREEVRGPDCIQDRGDHGGCGGRRRERSCRGITSARSFTQNLRPKLTFVPSHPLRFPPQEPTPDMRRMNSAPASTPDASCSSETPEPPIMRRAASAPPPGYEHDLIVDRNRNQIPALAFEIGAALSIIDDRSPKNKVIYL